jgi:predicted dehydrogenase
MIKIGIVSLGFMGMIHYLAARQLKGAQVAAICSRDPNKLAGDWRSIQGNFGPRGDLMDLSQVKKYNRLEALLADPDIDLIDVCNPTSLHPATAIQALEAGKDVLVEKCIALRPDDADGMLAAAARAKKLLMVAHVLPFFPEFAYALEAVQSGRYDRLWAAHFKRVISQPEWSADISDPAKTGGPAIDLHIHDTHFIGLLCGLPSKVFSTGCLKGGHVQYLTTQYLYGESGPCVSACSGAVAQKGRPFVHSYELYFEKATLVYESGVTPLTLFTQDGQSERPKLDGGDDPITAFAAEIQTAVDGVQARREPDLLSGKLARDALVMCHRECDSVRSGQAVAISREERRLCPRRGARG